MIQNTLSQLSSYKSIEISIFATPFYGTYSYSDILEANSLQKLMRDELKSSISFRDNDQAAKDPLSTYKSKREFDETPEPEGKVESNNKHRFVIQHHDAKKAGEHFDFRLENDDGAMSSWAIPKARLPNGKEKLLAQKTEDHPISYNKFEGEIPAGEYGAGKVEIHDSGTYEEIEWSASKIKIRLKGKKEKGLFTMVKTDGKRWLIMQGKEEEK
jgi:DNA ligase D-like protein (predicted 3'-phosphoesterase)